MTLTIILPPENGDYLQEQAQAVGLPVADYVTRIITKKTTLPPDTALPEMSFEEWDLLLRSETINAPPISPEALRRENIYRDEE